ncbi:peroxiredoxin [Anseongella ginsenosidimutans]|uniref:Peroxiredoxin n=1 Tax=Anseongella ginsenosidimutans TaxID=496056 RepID=A0A4R3KV92_9SPHI|nr:TlpA disulfide reductase family protein [Anseongella ginsenosidimutans]TCS87777.1 peroxiredoxin [Anseongella ginsenosidimutans]
MIKRLALLTGAIAFLLACNKPAGKTFQLKVQLEGLSEGEKVYLYKPDTATLEPQPVDSLVYAAGGLVFEGTVDRPLPFYLLFEKHKGGVEVFVEEGTIDVTGNISDIAAVNVQGSAAHDTYKEAINGLKEIDKKERALYQRYVAAQQENNAGQLAVLDEEYELLVKEREDFVIDFTGSHPASPVGPYLINAVVYDLDYKRVQPAFEKLNAEVKSHPFGKKLADRLAIAKNTSIGSPAPAFSGKNPEGETVSLESSLGKITLIDFWASWCAPCRKENPNVVKLYNEFQPLGLEIIGVSLDDNAEAWKQAIRDDQLEWKHLTDLQGFQSAIAREYGIMAIPQTYLVDENGVIIAKGLRGKALREKVEELLGS